MQILNGRYVEGFYIYARQLDQLQDVGVADAATATAVPYRMLTVLNGGGATSCTFAGLLKFTGYEFFMVPFYKTVDGKPSNTKQGRTLEDGECDDPLDWDSSPAPAKWNRLATRRWNEL